MPLPSDKKVTNIEIFVTKSHYQVKEDIKLSFFVMKSHYLVQENN